MIKKAVIVAAGLSSRLYPLTLEKPKGLLPINEQPLLMRSVEILKANGIEDISIVVGYRNDMIKQVLGDTVNYIVNPFYKLCNNMGSLWFAKTFIHDEPFIYLHGDIVYDEKILTNALVEGYGRNNHIELVTHFGPSDEEAMKVRIDKDNLLIESNKSIRLDDSAGEWIGIAVIKESRMLFQYMEELLLNENYQDYDTLAFSKMAYDGFRIFCSSTYGMKWIEIDFLEDYERAKRMFSIE